MNRSNPVHSAAEQHAVGFFAHGVRLGRLLGRVCRRLPASAFLAAVTALVVLILLTACSAPSGGG